MRRRLLAATCCAGAAALAWGLATLPFWLPRALDATPLAIQGTGLVAGLWAAGIALLSLASLACGVAALAWPGWGRRGAGVVLLVLVGGVPSLLLVLLALLLGSAGSGH